jgi:hypothetical protein
MPSGLKGLGVSTCLGAGVGEFAGADPGAAGAGAAGFVLGLATVLVAFLTTAGDCGASLAGPGGVAGSLMTFYT